LELLASNPIRRVPKPKVERSDFHGLVRALRLYFAGVPFEELLDSAHMSDNTNGHRVDAFDEDDLDRLFRYLDSKVSISLGWLNDRNEWGRRVLGALKSKHPRTEAYIRRTARNRRQILVFPSERLKAPSRWIWLPC